MDTSAAGSGGPPRGPQFDNRRVLAGLIDLVVVAVVAVVVMFAAGVVGGAGTELTLTLRVVVLAWALFYYFALESGSGQTLGKRIMGLRVLSADGQPAGMRAIGVRTLLRVIDGIGLYVVGLIAMIATGQRRQRLGDLAGGTIVTSADWQPQSGSRPAPTVAETPMTSAIVMPTVPAVAPVESAAPEPGPELPAAAIPSPFTPLSEDPAEPAAATAQPVVPEEPVVVVEPSVVEEPPVVVESSIPPPPPAVTLDAADSADPPLDGVVDGPADGTWEPLPEPAEGAAEDEPVKIRSVETMSAMELLMSELEEDEPAGHRPAS